VDIPCPPANYRLGVRDGTMTTAAEIRAQIQLTEIKDGECSQQGWGPLSGFR